MTDEGPREGPFFVRFAPLRFAALFCSLDARAFGALCEGQSPLGAPAHVGRAQNGSSRAVPG